MRGHGGILFCWHRLSCELSRAEDRRGGERAQAARGSRRRGRHRRGGRGRQAACRLADARAGEAGLREWSRQGSGRKVRQRRRRKAACTGGEHKLAPWIFELRRSRRLQRALCKPAWPHQLGGRALELDGPGNPSFGSWAAQGPWGCRNGLATSGDREAHGCGGTGGESMLAEGDRNGSPPGESRQPCSVIAGAKLPVGVRMVAQRSAGEVAIVWRCKGVWKGVRQGYEGISALWG